MRGKYYLSASIGIIFILGYYFLRKKKPPKNIPKITNYENTVKPKNKKLENKLDISKEDDNTFSKNICKSNINHIDLCEDNKSSIKIQQESTDKIENQSSNSQLIEQNIVNLNLKDNSEIEINDSLPLNNIEVSLNIDENMINDEIIHKDASIQLMSSKNIECQENDNKDNKFELKDLSINEKTINKPEKNIDISEENILNQNSVDLLNENDEDHLSHGSNVHDCVIYYDKISKESELNNSMDSIKHTTKDEVKVGLSQSYIPELSNTTEYTKDDIHNLNIQKSLKINDSVDLTLNENTNNNLLFNENILEHVGTMDTIENLDVNIVNINTQKLNQSENSNDESINTYTEVEVDNINISNELSDISHISDKKDEINQDVDKSMNDLIKEVPLDTVSDDSGQVSDYALNVAASESNSEVNSPDTSSSLSPELKVSNNIDLEAEKNMTLAQKGAQSTEQPGHFEYEFDFPSEICGRLIGKVGKNINLLKDKSGVEITIKRKPFCKAFQVICIEGAISQIDLALDLIKDKFPPMKYPDIDYSPIDSNNIENLQHTFKLPLEIGEATEVIVSSVVSVNHVFVQQPNHSSYKLLEKQNLDMMACYGTTPILLYPDTIVPMLPHPIEVGTICAAPMYGEWYRALIVNVIEETDDCEIKFIDFGGYKVMNAVDLRQIRSDFTALPFQATECFLSNIAPIGDEFTEEDNIVMRNIVYGKNLQCEVVYKEDNTPYCNLYVCYPDQEALYVNKELVDKGAAQWIEF